MIQRIVRKALWGLFFCFFSNLFAKNVVQDLTSAGSSDTDSFMEELKELAKGDDRILFTGFVQGAMLDFGKSAGEHSSTA